MGDREKILRGAECCKYEPSQNGCPEECPYLPEGHLTCGLDPLLDDVIALLNEQGPRVMTLNELTEIYVEFKGDACPVRLTNFDLAKIIMYAEDGICRLWTGKPNNEQREAVKWDA